MLSHAFASGLDISQDIMTGFVKGFLQPSNTVAASCQSQTPLTKEMRLVWHDTALDELMLAQLIHFSPTKIAPHQPVNKSVNNNSNFTPNWECAN